ncbi:PGA3 Plasma membrane-associated coenzyme Q6 reductase PGA3 [Candida maltosa Xu316]
MYGALQHFELVDKTLIAPMTAIYRFKLRKDDEVLDIPTGHSLACCFNIDGKDEVRYYTPISNQFDAGFFDILIKHYDKGIVTRKLANVQIGQTVKFRGPFGKLDYVPNEAKEIALVAGGTGITPMLQIITRIITNLDDKTKIKLLFANNTSNDILLKEELDNMASKYQDLEIKYVTEVFVTKDDFEFFSPESKFYVCGPPAFVKHVNDLAIESGYTKDDIFNF